MRQEALKLALLYNPTVTLPRSKKRRMRYGA